MNKMLGSIKRRPTVPPAQEPGSVPGSSEDVAFDRSGPGDPPEVTAARCVRLFCESSGPNSSVASGDEVTYLPPIVDAAESSPAAAAECARIIRKFLHKDFSAYQYNAIMLMRILADNPGPTFTRNLDKKFTDTTKDLLRGCRDPSVRQLLMETLDSFESTKSHDEGLMLLIEMWKKEKEKAYKAYGGRPPPAPLGPRPLNAPAFDPHSQNYFARSHHNKRLPNAVELANRLEEARTSAKLLEQVAACTPPSEVLSNDLIKEFADRCLSASRSIQGYMAATDPVPDNDTMESMIDTNEQLQAALNTHQRAIVNGRKQLGLGERSSPNENNINASGPIMQMQRQNQPPIDTLYEGGPPPPPLPSRKQPSSGAGKGKTADALWALDGTPSSSRPSRSANGTPPRPPAKSNADGDDDDPFRDPEPSRRASDNENKLQDVDPRRPRLAIDFFHPGFTATPSYLGKQESALNKVQMHGAVDEVPSPLSAGSTGARVRGSTTAATPTQRAQPHAAGAHDDDDLYDDDNMYTATPKKTGPVYRY